MPTETFIAGNGDGVVSNVDSDYNACHDADVGVAAVDSDTELFINYRYSDGDYGLDRAFLPFDTSSLPDNALIESAVLKICVTDTGFYTCIEGDKLCVVQTSQASVSSLCEDDFNEVGNIKGGEIPLSSIESWTCYEIQLNESALNWINKGEWTRLGLRFESDINESAPYDWRCALWIAASEYDTPGARPSLTVTYSTPPEYTLDIEPSLIPTIGSRFSKTIDAPLELTGKAAKVAKALMEIILNTEIKLGTSFIASENVYPLLSYNFSGTANTEFALIDQSICCEPSVSATYPISISYNISPLSIESLLTRLVEEENAFFPTLLPSLGYRCAELSQFDTSLFIKAKYIDIAPWWDESWEYRYPVFIWNNTGRVLQNYEVRVDLSSSNFDYSLCKSDGGDLRFITPDGAKLPYWIEEWNYGGNSKIWVKAKEVPTGKPLIFYMYCRNPNAESESNGKNTFLLFEDFEEYNEGVLDGQGNWEEEGDTENFEVVTDEVKSGSKAVRVNAQVGITKIVSIPSDTGFAIRSYIWGDTDYQRPCITIQEDSNEIAGIKFGDNGYIWYVRGDGWADSNKIASDYRWYKVEQWISGSGEITKVFINDLEYVHDESAKIYSNPNKIRLSMTWGTESDTGYARWDQIIIRKWTTGVSYPQLGQVTFFSSTLKNLLDIIPDYERHLKLNNTFIEGGVLDASSSFESLFAHALCYKEDFDTELITCSPLWKVSHLLDSLLIIESVGVSPKILYEFLPEVQTIILPRLTVVIIG
ncbi:MAG: hypothetical protein QIT36_gp102 [Methanophagales virus GBV301]|uniref:DUF2341 domain-containing protein n=1 Tax=Methanophagales virus GBV301 TaxID=2999280 RepID=A0A9E8VAU3_9CAUD|nr:MAG: hypothetical protein QIT36_gp102 [Methanophagales virus GBV301]WAE39526.1 MAG: hypothetical protein LDLAKGPJ_00102 [Methanophagales virus GBV301]